MFKKINIKNFGSFRDFEWKREFDQKEFKKINVIYGRNYSGKTTLSKIFQSLETRELPEKYENIAFDVFNNGNRISQNQIEAHSVHVRVYNSDFVAENLSFLNRTDGKINTFAVIGASNNEIAKQIKKIEEKIGSIEGKTGLEYKSKDETDRFFARKKEFEGKQKQMDADLTNKAKRIKKNMLEPDYNITKIEKDIAEIQRNSKDRLLAEDERCAKENLSKVDRLLPIDGIAAINLRFDEIAKNAILCLEKSIQPTQAIEDLLHNHELQSWVKEGQGLHKDKREHCAFCGGQLTSEVWSRLGAHFNQESKFLEEKIEKSIKEITQELDRIPKMFLLTKDKFYPVEQIKFEQQRQEINEFLQSYKKDLQALESRLIEKKSRLFEGIPVPPVTHHSDALQNFVDAVNQLINENNARSDCFEVSKKEARKALILDDVARWMQEYGYKDREEEIKELKGKKEEAEKEYTITKSEIEKLKAEKDQLLLQQKDEKRAVDRINQLMTRDFGLPELKLQAKTDSAQKNVEFKIMRGDKLAHNLSEGERSLIAFCYFIAKLEEIENEGKELVVYIDDPISSLDSSHIYFVFSLISTLIASGIAESENKKGKYKQLFVSTHNLEFLKYLKSLVHKEKLMAYFWINREQDKSTLQPMPTYLRTYVTEFNYLFHQIVKCRDGDPDASFSFGNNARKFLEAYLFFKYPGNTEAFYKKLNEFIDKHSPNNKEEGCKSLEKVLLNRFLNEQSHLGETPDRSNLPMDIPEAQKVAQFLLDLIECADRDQFDSLRASIGQSEVKG